MNASRLFVTASIALLVALRAVETFGRPLQVDEAYTLWYAHLPLHDMFVRLAMRDVHPPLLFLLLRPLDGLALGDGVYRAIAFALSLASLWLLFAIVRMWFDARAGFIAAVCAGLIPNLIFYDSWIRMYALFDFEALLSVWLLSVLLTRADLSANLRCALWLGWTICVAAQWYTDYLGFMSVAAQLVFVAFVRRDAFARALAGTAVVAIAWLPQLPVFAQQTRFGGTAFEVFRGREGLAVTLLPGNAIIGNMHPSAGELAQDAILWFWLVAAFAVTLVAAGRSILPWLAAPSALLVVFSLASHKLLYADRYHLLLAYGFAAWTGVALSYAWRRVPSVAVTATAVAGAALIALAAVHVLDPDFTTAPWPAVAAILRSQTHPGDLLALDQGNSLWVLQREHAIDDRAVLAVFGPPRANDVNGHLDAARRVFYVGFQTPPVDPEQIVYDHLSRTKRPVAVWQFTRTLPEEHVLVELFAR